MKARILLVLSVALSACTAAPPAPLPPPPEQPETEVDNPTCVSCGWVLEEPDLNHQLSQAEAGDGEAAFRISMHYVSKEDQPKASYWLRRAADLGHPVAQYNLWFDLHNSPKCADHLAALSWLEKAAAQGETSAKSQLDGYRKEVASCD